MTAPLLFEREGVQFTAYDINQIAPHVSVEVARRRLRKWAAGKVDCDALFSLQRPGNTAPNKCLLAQACKGLGPRRDPSEIRISKFERELNAQLDQHKGGYYGLERSSKARPSCRD